MLDAARQLVDGARGRRRLDAAAWIAAALLAGIPGTAGAHAGAGHVHGFPSGLAHPLSGWDHQLAMIAIGLWAVQQRGHARAATPLGFVVGAACGLIAGGALGLGSLAPLWLTVSTVAVGVAVALVLRPGVALAPLAALGVGLLHGHAHGSDLAASVTPTAFAAGFLVATAALHAFGFGLARIVPPRSRDAAAALGGIAIAVAGMVLLVAHS